MSHLVMNVEATESGKTNMASIITTIISSGPDLVQKIDLRSYLLKRIGK